MPEQQAETPDLLVSVVIVTYNVAAPLRRCLAALESSPDRAQFEVIVVDNGSRDGSQAIDSEFPNVTVLRLPHHCGTARPRNIGMRTAKGTHILLLSPLVELEKGAVTALAHRLEGDDTALAVCPLVVDEDGKIATKVRLLPDASQVKACWRDPVGLPVVALEGRWNLHDGLGLLIRKRSIQGINFLDENYGEYWVDVELAYQIERAGKRIALAQDIKGTLLKADRILSGDASIRASFAADAVNGAAVYLGKRFGGMTGFLFRVQMTLLALVQTLTFQDPGYAASLLSRVSGGFKIDGTTNQFS